MVVTNGTASRNLERTRARSRSILRNAANGREALGTAIVRTAAPPPRSDSSPFRRLAIWSRGARCLMQTSTSDRFLGQPHPLVRPSPLIFRQFDLSRYVPSAHMRHYSDGPRSVVPLRGAFCFVQCRRVPDSPLPDLRVATA